MGEISNQERREVAQRLRALQPTYIDGKGCYLAENIAKIIVNRYDDLMTVDDVRRIADLIDRPIVASHYVARPEDTAMLITGRSSQQLHCGNCGKEIIRSYRYCPQCGVELKK